MPAYERDKTAKSDWDPSESHLQLQKEEHKLPNLLIPPNPAAQVDSKDSAQAMAHWADPAHRPTEAESPVKAGADEDAAKQVGEAQTGGDLVLNGNPADATASSVSLYATIVKLHIESWGLAFSASAVYLGGSPGKKAIMLKWDPAWGSAPHTRTMPPSLTPIDDRAAVAAAHKLAGFAKLEAADQSIVENLLGGENNSLSSTARRVFAAKLATIKGQNEGQQATMLKGLVTGKEALPQLVNEVVATQPTKFTLAGPTEKKEYAFRGKKADANEWVATYDDGTKVSIIEPKTQEAGLHNHTVQQTADSASYLPKSARAVINTIVLNVVTNPEDAHWATEYKDPNFHSYMTAGAAGVVSVYPDKADKRLPTDSVMRGSLLHETGHTFSYKKWGSDTTKGKWADWKTAMGSDKVSVSQYATNAIAEDVAETIQVYGSTRGTPRFDEYKAILPNRFKILDTEYGS